MSNPIANDPPVLVVEDLPLVRLPLPAEDIELISLTLGPTGVAAPPACATCYPNCLCSQCFPPGVASRTP